MKYLIVLVICLVLMKLLIDMKSFNKHMHIKEFGKNYGHFGHFSEKFPTLTYDFCRKMQKKTKKTTLSGHVNIK